ncbi:putative Pol polyprotein, partial [Gregarina niphandrodes]
DVAVIGATYEECKERITKLCEKLQAKKFTINYDKSVVEPQTQLEFLGHLICSGHVTIHPDHAETICKSPTSETSAELHSFLGFGNCFHRFIPRYAELVAPLYKVLKREPYHLATAEKESCIRVQHAIAMLPSLHTLDSHSPLVLDTDACQRGIGAYLYLQLENELLPLAHAPHAFTKQEGGVRM